MIPNHMKWLSVGFALLAAAGARAENFEFDDGRRYSGEIVGEDNLVYTVMVDGMRVQLPKSRVTKLDSDAKDAEVKTVAAGVTTISPIPGPARIHGVTSYDVPRTDVDINREQNGISVSYEPAPTPAPEPETAEPARPLVFKYPLPDDPVELQGLRDWVDSLPALGPTYQGTATERLNLLGDSGLAALATHGLYNPRPSVRTRAAELLGTVGGQRALKPLIEAFYSAAQPTIPPYQVAYVETLTSQISRLTGLNFEFYPRSSREAPAIADQMVAWWNANFDRMPAQLGEPKISMADPNYVAKIRAMRSLKLEKLAFDGESYPPEVLNLPRVERTNEGDNVEFIPEVPRNSALERPLDRLYGELPR